MCVYLYKRRIMEGVKLILKIRELRNVYFEPNMNQGKLSEPSKTSKKWNFIMVLF